MAVSLRCSCGQEIRCGEGTVYSSSSVPLKEAGKLLGEVVECEKCERLFTIVCGIKNISINLLEETND